MRPGGRDVCKSILAEPDWPAGYAGGRSAVRGMTRGEIPEFDLAAADALIAARTRSESFACRRGCSWCCHQLVVLTCHEDGRAILTAARERLTAEQFAAFGSAVRDQAERIAALPHEQAEARRWPCPLLVDGECIVYDLRPVACRSVFSGDPECCISMLNATRFEELTEAHRAMAIEIGERAMALQIEINDRRPIDGPIELRALLARLLDGD